LTPNRNMKTVVAAAFASGVLVGGLAMRFFWARFFPRGLSLNQVTLQVKDVVRSLKFYQELGFLPIVYDEEAKYARLELQDSNQVPTVSLHDVGGAIYFEAGSAPELNQRVEALQAKGVPISNPVDQSWGWREAHIQDPNGNMIILYYAGAMRRWPPWRLP